MRLAVPRRTGTQIDRACGQYRPHQHRRQESNVQHSSFRWGSANRLVLYAWVGAQSDLNDTLNVATHEIDEAVGDNGSAGRELCDECASDGYGGVSPGISTFTVASYYDRQKDECVAPPKFKKKI